MNESRRGFVKKAAIAGVVATAAVATAQAGGANQNRSNGVVIGKSKKTEITYKKTQAWEDFYKSAM